MRILLLMFLLLFSKCMTTTTNNKSITESQSFVCDKSYLFTTKKSDIPLSVIESISEVNSTPFNLGDSSELLSVNLTDVRNMEYKFNSLLHFALIGDSSCLIVYTQGGFGTHDVVDFIRYKGANFHERYSTLEFLSDTIKLEKFLQNDPVPVKLK
jgi:hypothetical protein